MAEVKKPPTVAPADKPAPDKPAGDGTRTGYEVVSLAEHEQLKKKLAEHEDRSKRLNFAIRQLAAAIVTPAAPGDKGQGRLNTIGQSIQKIVKEIGFEEDE